MLKPQNPLFFAPLQLILKTSSSMEQLLRKSTATVARLELFPQLSRRFTSSAADFAEKEPILVRDYIKSALYNPIDGYFSKRSGSVGVLDKAINFNQLKGRKDYTRHLNNLYRKHGISWFTPVELFKPWYAYGIAEAILRTADLSVPLKIYEIGGGSGTCAKNIMDYMMLNAPTKVYANMSYISVEISKSLAGRQMETVGEVQSHLSRYKVECRDAADRIGWGIADPHPCWVIMLEVLDNLPHDLIYRENQISEWKEVCLEKLPGSLQISEVFKPLHDPLISHCLDITRRNNGIDVNQREVSALRRMWSKIFPKPRRIWLPTGCLKLFDVLHWALPKMSMIVSDFSYLPDVKIPGESAPLVSTKKDGVTVDHSSYLDAKKDGVTVDHSSYLDAKGDADIFFPTDFCLLETMDHHCSIWNDQNKESNPLKTISKRRTIILDTALFMEEFGLPSKTRTRDEYNPLLDDFKNTKFYISVPTHNIK